MSSIIIKKNSNYKNSGQKNIGVWLATLHGSLMKTLTMKDLVEFFNHLENALDILDKKDPNAERAGLTYRRVMQDVVCYKEILQEKRRVAQQATLHAYFSSKISNSDEPQVSTSKKHSPKPPPCLL